MTHELRAALRLARLWANGPRAAEARAHVERALGAMISGDDTPDVIEARALLAER